MSALDKALIKAYQQRVGGPHASFAVRAGVAHPPPMPDGPQVAPVVVAGPPPVTSPAAVAAAAPQRPDFVAGLAKLRADAPQTAPPAPSPALEIERFDWPPLVSSLREVAAEAWHSLAEELLKNARTLLVTGCRRGEGRTSVALFAASMLAVDGRRVGLIDADFSKPQLAERLGVMAPVGWTEAVAHQLPVAEAMVESLSDRVILLPLRRGAATISAMDAGAVQTAIGALQGHCDLICVDAGPMIDSSDAACQAVLAAGIDAALLVRDVRHSRLEQSHAVGRRLTKAGIDRWAIIDNFARAAHV